MDGKVRIVYPGLCNHGKGDCPDPKCAGGQTPSWANGDPHDCPSKNIAVAVPSNYSGDPLLRNWTKTGAPVSANKSNNCNVCRSVSLRGLICCIRYIALAGLNTRGQYAYC